MISRAQELCRKLKPVLGGKIDRLWFAYIAESDAAGRTDIEQTLELLAAKHLKQDYSQDHSPFPPPAREFAASGDIPLGVVSYADKDLYPFSIGSNRLKEHLLICGRSGSGKTNLTFILMEGIMARGIKIVAMDWKRGYRDLLQLRPDIQVFTVGRNVSPLRFNPLIPPPGCEPNTWLKLIVDVIASAYFGGEGVISLLVAGLDHLYREAGVFDGLLTRWPTIEDLLAWLRTTKLTGRAAMWKASAERILLAMTYGEFGDVLAAQDNAHVRELLHHNVVLEMDGLSSNADRRMFSEALTLYLYRYRLAEGPVQKLTNVVVVEEAHNLLLRKGSESRESVLESSIRMIRQYGLGYVFIDQSASLLSKVAFANSYATIALSQKLKDDIQAMSAAMNLTDEQKQSLNTLPIGSAVVRLADEHPEPFLVKVPLCQIQEGQTGDEDVRRIMRTHSTDSSENTPPLVDSAVIPPSPAQDRKEKHLNRNSKNSQSSHPPPLRQQDNAVAVYPDVSTHPPGENAYEMPDPPELSRECIRFLADLVARPLSTTVNRYHRLHLSRRRGNAIRRDLLDAGFIEGVPLATRSGQVVLYQLTDPGRSLCRRVGIDPGLRPRESLEHRYWVVKAAQHYEDDGFSIFYEYSVKGNGAVDVLAERHDRRLAIEVETGKSNIQGNLLKLRSGRFDEIVLLATSPSAVTACQKAIESVDHDIPVRLMTWLDVS